MTQKVWEGAATAGPLSLRRYNCTTKCSYRLNYHISTKICELDFHTPVRRNIGLFRLFNCSKKNPAKAMFATNCKINV